VTVAALQLTTGWGAFLSIIVLGTLFLIWLVALFLVLTDAIPGLMKALWVLALICLAPFAIPAYFLVRVLRSAHRPAPAR
jgi:hypothetical protein